MSRRGRRLTAVLGVLVVVLFAGRWSATLLADRWWAAEFSPAAASFVTDWHLLQLTLELCGCLVASAWFIGHLFLVYRAVGTVQIRRNVANLEFREALTPRTLLTIAVATGVLLGLLVGAGTSSWWREVTLAWQGVSYGVNEPLLSHDLGLYVAQLPVWRAAHGFLVLLVLLALSGVTGLYVLVGAIRWMDRRPAINDHARAHLGWLFALLAVALAWGYLLERYELVAGPADLLDQSVWQATLLVSPVLAGVALAAGALSVVWAVRPRHTLAVAGWIVLVAASMVGHWLLPSILGGSAKPVIDAQALQRLSAMAFGLEGLRDSQQPPTGQPAPPEVPSFWNPSALAQALPGDSSHLAISPAVLSPGGSRLPAWLVVRAGPAGRIVVSAVADHRVSPTGDPLFYRLGDTLPRPTHSPLLDLRGDGANPDAPNFRVRQGDGPGVPVDTWTRRLILAWALQAGPLLGDLRPRSRIDWRLSPEDRLARLAPFADWSAPTASVVDGDLVWLLNGYVTSSSFPLTGRVAWRERRVGSVGAAFLGTVSSESGATRIFLQPGADALAEAWSQVSDGVVEPASSIPEAVLRAAAYPTDLFRVQLRELQQAPWKAGSPSGQVEGSPESPTPQVGWAPDTSGPLVVSTFESPTERRLSAVLTGWRDDGRAQLVLTRLDSTSTVPVRGVLENLWSNFPSYEALNDSIRDDGGKLERGPLQVDVGRGAPVAYETYFAPRQSGGMILAWVSVAAPGEGRPRLGAGRNLKEAWSNLLGATVPAPPGVAQTGRLEEARRWLQRADSALRAGDWSEFGHAWGSLRNALGLPADTGRF